jgi:hypothetical protein
VHELGCDAAALTAFETDQAIAFHGPQRTGEVRLGLAGDPGQLVERAGRLLGDDAQQLAIAGQSTFAKDSVEVNQTFGSSAATRRSPRATAMVRAFISS